MRVWAAFKKYLHSLTADAAFHAPSPFVGMYPRSVPGIPWEDRDHPDSPAARDRAYAAYERAVFADAEMEGTIPHCDARVLHAPAACEYCDRPSLQKARFDLGIALSGQAPSAQRPYPCPADAAVERGERGDYNAWHGNVPHAPSIPSKRHRGAKG